MAMKVLVFVLVLLVLSYCTKASKRSKQHDIIIHTTIQVISACFRSF